VAQPPLFFFLFFFGVTCQPQRLTRGEKLKFGREI
jgi:hypothetical protein